VDDDLNAESRALIARAMLEDVPHDGVADGSWGAVVSRLTSEVPAEGPAGAGPTPASRNRVWVVVGVAFLAAAVVIAVWVGRLPAKPTAVPPPPPPTVDRTKVVHEGPAARAPETEQPEVAPDPAAIARWLDDAEAATKAGRPDEALELLQRHADAAPIDVDAQRRMVLRIEALCASKRDREAADEAAAFRSRERDAKWLARVARSCVGKAP
jgi:hypothetical protein